MGKFLAGLLPSKYIIMLILALVAGLVYFYQSNQINAERVRTAEAELSAAKTAIATQQTTIDRMTKDAEVQQQLMIQYNLAVQDIRQKTFEDLLEISNTDFAKEANTNAVELEKIVNERTKRLFDSISNVSKGTK